MTKTQHTPGPWVVTGPLRRCIGIDRTRLAECYPNPVANAARIVACVNACEGIDDPSVIPEVLFLLRRLASGRLTPRDVDRALKLLETVEDTK